MLLDLWLAALRSVKGVAVKTNNRALMRQHLYRARVEAENPSFDEIVIIMPDNEDELWLVHKDADGIGTNHEGHPKLVR